MEKDLQIRDAMKLTFLITFVLAASMAGQQSVAEVEAPAADDCSTIRLDDAPEKVMSHVMVHDQGKAGICYAEAAAQMTDAYRFGILKEKTYARQTAPAVAAIKSSEISTNPADPFGGGYTCKVIDFIRKDGSHDNAVFSSCRDRLASMKSSQFDSIFDDYQAKIYEKRSELEASGRLRQSSAEFAAYSMKLAAQKQRELASCATAASGSVTADPTGVREHIVPALSILHTYLDQNREQFTGEMIAYACSNQDNGEKLPALPQCHALRLNTGASKEQLMKKIDNQFRATPLLPTAIGYCDQTLTQGRNYAGIASVTTNPPTINCATPGNDEHGGLGRHESLIVGRRRDAKGTCQYLIRNSWGTNCSRKNPQKPDQPVARYSADWECEEGKGNIWVDRDSIAKSLFEVSYLK